MADAALLSALGAASAYLSVLVLALYINSGEVTTLYGHPKGLWAACPLLLYWLSRLWLLAHRGQLDDDPVEFAARDAATWLVGLGLLATLALAVLDGALCQLGPLARRSAAGA